MFIDNINNWLQKYPLLYENLQFLGIILLAYFSYIITKKIIIRGIKSFVKRTKTEFDDIFLNEKTLRRIALIAPLVILYQFTYLVPSAEKILLRVLDSLIVLLILFIIGSLITSINSLSERIERYKDKPIKGYLQVVRIVFYILGSILIAGILTGQDPLALFTGIGALTAIIILIFRDTILSFVASIQISSYDLLKKGDWIEMGKYGADGDVIDIALNVIKVQNWDKTITVIPTYKLIEESFKNWRGMKLTGGRRIKRPIFIDISSIKFLDNEMIEKFEKFQLIADYIKEKKKEVEIFNKEMNVDLTHPINGRRLTNLGTFRAYLKAYLKQRKDVHTELTFLVRYLEPGPGGLPIEIYVFANTTVWALYEEIQAEIFDHLFAVIPEFELKVFQNPTGNDIKFLKSNN